VISGDFDVARDIVGCIYVAGIAVAGKIGGGVDVAGGEIGGGIDVAGDVSCGKDAGVVVAGDISASVIVFAEICGSVEVAVGGVEVAGMIEVIGGGVVEDGIVVDVINCGGFANGRSRSAIQTIIVIAFIRQRRPPILRMPPPPI